MFDNDLPWGTTVWDDMEPEQMRRELQRMYATIISMNSCMRMAESLDPSSPYWGKEGSGGIALEKARQVLEPIGGTDEPMYRGFFRYAVDLLFDQSTGYKIGFGWAVCPVCGRMFGASMQGKSYLGTRCGDNIAGRPECPGVMRALEWSDLAPEVKE